MVSHRTISRALSRTAASFVVVATAALVAAAFPPRASAHEAPLRGAAGGSVPEQLLFPVIGAVSYRDDFGEPRGQGPHQANDIVAARRAPVVAVEAGRVRLWTSSARAGCMLYLHGQSRTTYLYVHLNNDLGGGNDNRGGCAESVAFAPGLRDGQQVRAGQLLGYVGDSGDANGIHPHLHFEIHPGGGAAVSPYAWLQRAQHLLFAASEGAPTEGATGAGLAASPRPDLRLALYGSVIGVVPGEPAGQLVLRVRRVRLSTGGRAEVAQDVVVSIPTEAVLQRTSGRGRAAADLASSLPGEEVVVWTGPLAPTLEAQLAGPGVLSAAQVLLRGLTA